MQPMWLCLFRSKLFEETFENAQCRKVKRMQPMWLCICSGRQFNACLDPSSLRKHLITDNKEKSKQMWLCLFRSKLFEETFESAQCRKVKQMQPMQLSICSGRQFEVTSENAQFKNSNKPLKTHCRKIKKMLPMWLVRAGNFRTHQKTHSGKKSNKCNQGHFAC